MKTHEALSMLIAAREGVIPDKEKAIRQYGKQSKKILQQIGMKEEEMNDEYPDDQLQYGLFLVCNHPTVFAQQARASAAWLISRN